MKIKILLIGERLVHRSFNGANKALPVLHSSLERAGFDRVVSLDLERPDVSIADVLREAVDADLVGFAGCLTPQWPQIDEHARLVDSHLSALGRHDVPILVGGYATKGVEDIARLTPWIDGYFNGEGEVAIVEIAQSVAAGTFPTDRARIPGLCFVDTQREFHSSLAPRVPDLDPYDQNHGLVHVPAVHDMDIFRSRDGRQLKTAQIYTQRGCPWACGYCNKSMESNRVARLGEESLRWQLRQLKNLGYEAVYLDVDTFTVNPTMARREADILHEEGFVWGSNTRIDRIDLALLDYFKAKGCVYMFYGVEHTHPDVVLAIQKFNGTLQRQLELCAAYPLLVQRAITEMRAVGLPSSYFVILGLPKAILSADRREIIDYQPTRFEDDIAAIRVGLEHCQPDYLNLNVLRFMPGSAAADTRGHPAYASVRPSGAQPITAGYFLPRVADALGYSKLPLHGVFRLCESVGGSQPISTAMDAQRVYDTFKWSLEFINQGIDAGRSAVKLFIEKEILEKGLVKRDDSGHYSVAGLKSFEGL